MNVSDILVLLTGRGFDMLSDAQKLHSGGKLSDNEHDMIVALHDALSGSEAADE